MDKTICCEWHDNIDDSGIECGLAGMGNVTVCCRNCPDLDWYKKNQPTRTVDFYEDEDGEL